MDVDHALAADDRSTRAARWTCPVCGRSFARRNQRHSWQRVPIETHIPPDSMVRGLFDAQVAAIEATVGPCELVSLPCCSHLAAADDFLAVLPRRDRLDIRFMLHRRIDDPRIAASSQTSRTTFTHRVLVTHADDIDTQLLGWIAEASEETDDERGVPAVPDSSGRRG